jgi:hypothetical protein
VQIHRPHIKFFSYIASGTTMKAINATEPIKSFITSSAVICDHTRSIVSTNSFMLVSSFAYQCRLIANEGLAPVLLL